MSLMSKLGKLPVYRKCPAGHWHRVSAEHPECGHTGRILDWSEEWQKWIPNPTKTDVALTMIEEDEEFEVEREARLRLEEELKKGNIKPVKDFRRMIMNR